MPAKGKQEQASIFLWKQMLHTASTVTHAGGCVHRHPSSSWEVSCPTQVTDSQRGKDALSEQAEVFQSLVKDKASQVFWVFCPYFSGAQSSPSWEHSPPSPTPVRQWSDYQDWLIKEKKNSSSNNLRFKILQLLENLSLNNYFFPLVLPLCIYVFICDWEGAIKKIIPILKAATNE